MVQALEELVKLEPLGGNDARDHPERWSRKMGDFSKDKYFRNIQNWYLAKF